MPVGRGSGSSCVVRAPEGGAVGTAVARTREVIASTPATYNVRIKKKYFNYYLIDDLSLKS